MQNFLELQCLVNDLVDFLELPLFINAFFSLNMGNLSRPYPFKIFKGCFPQFLLGPLLNTLSHILLDEENRDWDMKTNILSDTIHNYSF